MKLLQAKRRIGIGVRLAIMIAVLLVLTTGSFALLSLRSQSRQAIDTYVESSLAMGRSLERILRFSMLENRRDEIESAIKQMATERSIITADLRTHAGMLVFSSSPISAPQASKADIGCAGCHLDAEHKPLKLMPSSSSVSIHEEPKIARISLPIYNAPECFASACHASTSMRPSAGADSPPVECPTGPDGANLTSTAPEARNICIADSTATSPIASTSRVSPTRPAKP